jgi:hypothetical protein
VAVRILSPEEVHAAAVAGLGLDPQRSDLTTPEAIAAALRRAAGFHCPCAPRVLVNAVLAPLRSLVPPGTGLAGVQDRVEALLDALAGYGDLLEAPEVHGVDSFSGPRVLYAAPPRFVLRRDGSAFLLGIVPDHRSALPEDLEPRVVHDGHVRRLTPNPGEDLGAVLAELGLIKCSMEAWFREPPLESSAEHQRRILRQLVPQRTAIENLMLLNPDTATRYYRGRWEPARRQTGVYVARRPQRYGADLWCVVDLEHGEVRRFLDLPLRGSPFRGCDEAWLLQAAVDAENDNPQLYRTARDADDEFLLELFSPVPQWAQRRWDLLGRCVEKRGALIAYLLPVGSYEEEIDFLKRRLWLRPRPAPAV